MMSESQFGASSVFLLVLIIGLWSEAQMGVVFRSKGDLCSVYLVESQVFANLRVRIAMGASR